MKGKYRNVVSRIKKTFLSFDEGNVWIY